MLEGPSGNSFPGDFCLLRLGSTRNHPLARRHLFSSPFPLLVGSQQARGTPSGISTAQYWSLLLLSGKWASKSLPKV